MALPVSVAHTRIASLGSKGNGWFSDPSSAESDWNSSEMPAPHQPNSADRIVEYFDGLRGPVLRYLRALGVRQGRAEDIIQETFLELHRFLLRGGRHDNIRSWVFRVAHNFLVDDYRSRRFEESLPATDEAEEISVDPSPSPEQAAMEAQRFDRLEAAIESLSAQQKRCLYLRAEGFRYREIARILGVSKSTVGEMLRRAIARLSEEQHE